MPEAVRVSVGNGVGDLDGDFNGTADVHLTAGRLGTKRLPLLELEGQIHPGVVFAAIVAPEKMENAAVVPPIVIVYVLLELSVLQMTSDLSSAVPADPVGTLVNDGAV